MEARLTRPAAFIRGAITKPIKVDVIFFAFPLLLLDRFEEAMGSSATVVATGGLAKYSAPHCRHTLLMDETLSLRGLRIIWDKNQK